MRTHHKRLRTFIELWAFPWGSVNNNWNIQINPLATPVFQPSFCTTEFLVEHTKSG